MKGLSQMVFRNLVRIACIASVIIEILLCIVLLIDTSIKWYYALAGTLMANVFLYIIYKEFEIMLKWK
jgi:hypothetical protein